MKTAAIVLVLAGMIAYGWYLMKNIDRILKRTRRMSPTRKKYITIEKNEVKEPTCVLITDDLSEEEEEKEIENFRKKYNKKGVIFLKKSEETKEKGQGSP